MTIKKILIADDHSIVRRGLKELLMDAFPFTVIEEVEDGESLLKKVLKEHWDIVISDISMPGRSGLEILQEIKKYQPKLPVLIMSMHSEDQYAIRVLKLAPQAILLKTLHLQNWQMQSTGLCRGKNISRPPLQKN